MIILHFLFFLFYYNADTYRYCGVALSWHSTSKENKKKKTEKELKIPFDRDRG